MAGIIEGKNTIEGTLGPIRSAGAPTAGTSSVQTLTFAATWAPGDTFQLAYNNEQTGQIAWSATNATLIANIDAALEALPSIGTGGVVVAVGTMTSGIGTATITAGGNLAKSTMPVLTFQSKTIAGNGTVVIAETTPGVTSTGRGAATGALLIDTTSGLLYENSGTGLSPTWGKVGVQS